MNPRHQAFSDECLKNGMNGLQAYKTVYKCSSRVAEVNSAKLLGNASIKGYIEQKRQKTAEKLKLVRLFTAN